MNSSEQSQVSPLLRLPTELRNKIYEYAFDTTIARPEAIDTSKQTLFAALLRELQGPNMVVTEAAGALRFTCRQLKAETAAYVGTDRHLEWHAMLSFVKIVSKIGETKARDIVSIYLPHPKGFIPLTFDDVPKNKLAARAHFPSLECIESSERGRGLSERPQDPKSASEGNPQDVRPEEHPCRLALSARRAALLEVVRETVCRWAKGIWACGPNEVRESSVACCSIARTWLEACTYL